MSFRRALFSLRRSRARSSSWRTTCFARSRSDRATPRTPLSCTFDQTSREAWIASLDAVAALNPKIVVAGHKRVGAADGPEHIGASQQYLRDFSRIVNERGTVVEILKAMLDLHGDRDNPRTLWHSARTAVAKRA